MIYKIKVKYLKKNYNKSYNYITFETGEVKWNG